MWTITKRDLTERVAEATGVPQATAAEVVQAFLDDVVRVLAAGDRIELRDFGVFEPRRRKPRRARNPKTGEDVEIPAKARVRFKPGRLMKEAMAPPAEASATI